MPSRLRPTAPPAADAILVGDPGRALLLAQELLEEPRMSNHARGLWGYSGRTPAGEELTIQATGMGGPSAAVVLGDLAQLGLRRAIRVGTCAGLGPEAQAGRLVLVAEAIAGGGSAASLGVAPGGAVRPERMLQEGLLEQVGGEARVATIASLDTLPGGGGAAPAGAEAVDMQTVALLASGARMGVAVAALLVVSEDERGERLGDEALEAAAKRAGNIASSVFST